MVRKPDPARDVRAYFSEEERNCLRSHGRPWRSAWPTTRRPHRRRRRRHTGADLNDAEVVGKVTPDKLPKKNFKPIALFLGVENSLDSTGNEDANAAAELIHISKNIKIDLKNTPLCETELSNGTPTDVARDICPKESYIGKGDATVAARRRVLHAAAG